MASRRSARNQLVGLWHKIPAHRRRWRYLSSVFFVIAALSLVGPLGTWWLPRVLWVFVGVAHGLLLGFYECQPIIDDLLALTKDQNALITKQNETLSKASVTIANQANLVDSALNAINSQYQKKIQ